MAGKYLQPPLAPRARTWPSRILNRPQAGGWLEPESAANFETAQPRYPFNKVQLTESGHSFEMDDTRGRERVRLQHRTGTFIEMHPNGDEVHKVYGDGYEITIADKNVLIKGHCSVEVQGDSVLNVKGDYTIKVDKDMNVHVGGRLTMVSEGNGAVLSKSDMTVGSGGDIAGAIGLGGSLRLASAADIHITGSLTVDGGVTCDQLTSSTSVDAKMGPVTSGIFGFSSVKGGLSIGQPIAVPMNIIATGAISSPFAMFGTMTSILMTDVINTNLYGIHFHKVITTKGPGIALPTSIRMI